MGSWTGGWVRLAAVGAAAASLVYGGAALGQAGPNSGTAGGPSNGYAGTAVEPPGQRGNTPVTGGGPTTQTGKASEKGTGDIVTGRVERIDRSGHTLRIEGVDRDLQLGPAVDVIRGSASASLDDVREGDQVRASMQPHGDQVRQLDILSRGTSANDRGVEAVGPQHERGSAKPGSGSPSSRSGSSSDRSR
jgi:hypothetical protein